MEKQQKIKKTKKWSIFRSKKKFWRKINCPYFHFIRWGEEEGGGVDFRKKKNKRIIIMK